MSRPAGNATLARTGRMPGAARVARGTLMVMALLGAGPAESPVADAAMRGDLDAVRALLAAGEDVNAPQGDGLTALHWAARAGERDMAELLLSAGADPSAGTRIGAYTPLHLAAQGGKGDVVPLLLEAGADPNRATVGVGGATPLHFAAASGDERSVRALVEAGAEVDARELAHGQTPLMFAAAAGRLTAVQRLLEADADVNARSGVFDVPSRAREDDQAKRARSERMRAASWPEPARGDSADGGRTNLRAAGGGPGSAQQPPPAARPSPREEVEQRQIEEPEPLSYADLVGGTGGFTALHHAAREGHSAVVEALLGGGADIDLPSEGDHSTPLLIAMINGHFDLGLALLERGADAGIASDAGTTPLFAVLNSHWAPKSRYPQQSAYQQQEADYLTAMRTLLEAGADPNVRLSKHLWFMSYNFDLLQIDVKGATPFWRAAYATDVEAMKLLVEFGADPSVPTEKVPERRRRNADTTDHSGLPPVPVGGPAAYPIHAAAGLGYGEGFAGNAHRHVPDGWIPAMTYLVEELGADVNARDHNGYTALHHAAARGDTGMILYLVDRGADVTVVSRAGQTTADMANGPVQRVQPFPEAVALLERLGSINNHRCVSC